MYITNKKEFTSRRRIVVPTLEVKRPTANIKTRESLEKKLDTYKMGFDKNSGKLFINRIKSLSERMAMVRSAAVSCIACAIMVVLIFGTATSIDLCFANEAIVSGKSIGVVVDKNGFEKLLVKVEGEMAEVLNEAPKQEKVVYIPRIIFKKDATSAYKLRQNLLSTYDKMTKAYAIYSGNTLICATLNEADANTALAKVKEQYFQEGTEMTLDFTTPVKIREEFVPTGYLCSVDGAVNTINTLSSEESVKYTVKEKDTLWGIASSNNMSVDDLIAMNKGLSENIHEGDIVFLKKAVPLVGVRASYISEEEVAVPFDTNNISDNKLAKGKKVVIQEGQNGRKKVVAEIVKVNGNVVEKNVQEEVVLSQPVTAKVRVGTKVIPSVGTGSFMRPVYGTITSRFGYRSRGDYHTGLDIAAPSGSLVEAADNGKVVFSGWKGTYGYLVIIEHNNGYQTYYGHCSSLIAKVGQTVEKGQNIARVGNTGNSTGPHLHFEVRKNGRPQNPSLYL